MTFAAASMFVACNSKTDSDLDSKKDVIVQDTSSMYNSNGSTDTAIGVVANPAPPVAAPTTTTTRTVTKTVYIDRRPRTQAPVQHSAPSNNVSTVPQTQTTTSGNGTTTTTGNGTTTTTAPAPVPEKKGWSSAAKDATIGGVGGAVGGAILSKNKGKGAVIGGIIGAAGGYIIGRKKDKKDTTR